MQPFPESVGLRALGLGVSGKGDSWEALRRRSYSFEAKALWFGFLALFSGVLSRVLESLGLGSLHFNGLGS